MKLNKEKNYSSLKDTEKTNYFHSSSIVDNHIINKTSTIKGNLFKNTSRSIKLLSKVDPLGKYNIKNFNFNYNEKDYENIVNSDFGFSKKNTFNPAENPDNNDNNNKFNCNFDNTSLEKSADKESKIDANIGKKISGIRVLIY